MPRRVNSAGRTGTGAIGNNKRKTHGRKAHGNWQVIVTGFNAFGARSSNLTEDIVRLFADELHLRGFGKVPVEGIVLETCCNAAWRQLNQSLKRHSQSRIVLIMTGLADFRAKITPERVALNLRDYRIRDNHGHKRVAEKIDPRLDNALLTDVPVDEIRKALRRQGVPCDVSNHAGTFVCNETYFKALRYQMTHKNVRSVLFVHIPLPETYLDSLRHDNGFNGRHKPAKPSYGNGKNVKQSAVRRSEGRQAGAGGKQARADKQMAIDMLTDAIEKITLQCLRRAIMQGKRRRASPHLVSQRG